MLKQVSAHRIHPVRQQQLLFEAASFVVLVDLVRGDIGARGGIFDTPADQITFVQTRQLLVS